MAFKHLLDSNGGGPIARFPQIIELYEEGVVPE